LAAPYVDRAGHDRGAIPAHEGSGVVIGFGYGTAGSAAGDEVYGFIDGYRDGWATEYLAIEARSLAPHPADFVQARSLALGTTPAPPRRHGPPS
jgi:NADPH:quinone reductase-like Zn-dependent oxidoreductase